MYVAANKCDLYKNIPQGNIEEGREYANSINAMFFETSGKESIGINEILNDISMKVSDLLNPKTDEITDPIVLKKENHEKKKQKSVAIIKAKNIHELLYKI